MKIKISRDFSKSPGPRYIIEGKNSGEEFLNKILLPKFNQALESKEHLNVDLDGSYGYGTSFLDEAFGGLVRETGKSLFDIFSIMSITSNEEPPLIDEIKEYMENAVNGYQ